VLNDERKLSCFARKHNCRQQHRLRPCAAVHQVLRTLIKGCAVDPDTSRLTRAV